jgi:hypothetical protein
MRKENLPNFLEKLAFRQIPFKNSLNHLQSLSSPKFVTQAEGLVFLTSQPSTSFTRNNWKRSAFISLPVMKGSRGIPFLL